MVQSILNSPTTKLYEGVFLLSQEAVGADPAAGVAMVGEFLKRADAEVITLRKWDERKLAYTIAGQKRGTYFDSLFRASPQKIAGIERDCNLSEDVLRMMVLSADHMGQPEIDAAIEEQNNPGGEKAAEAKPE